MANGVMFDFMERKFVPASSVDQSDGSKLYVVTSTAAVPTASADFLNGAVAGTAVASKALVTNSSNCLNIGALSSANDTSGITVSASVSKVIGIHADTGGIALGAGFTRAALARFFIGTAITSGADISAAGFEGLLKFGASANMGGNCGGIMGHLESTGTLTLTGSINTVKAGVASFLDLATNATVAASTVVSAFGVNPANFGTVMTGRSAIIHVTNPMAGTWSAFLDLSSATGCVQDSAAGATPGKHLKIYLNGVLHTIPTVTA
jgi:hypothetical protein